MEDVTEPVMSMEDFTEPEIKIEDLINSTESDRIVVAIINIFVDGDIFWLI